MMVVVCSSMFVCFDIVWLDGFVEIFIVIMNVVFICLMYVMGMGVISFLLMYWWLLIVIGWNMFGMLYDVCIV